MTIGDQIRCSIDDFEDGTKFEASLSHSCTGINATSTKLFGNVQGEIGKNYKKCLRQYYWLLEPMLGSINLVDTKFTWGRLLSKTLTPDLTDIVYEAFRCTHAHGAEHPISFSYLPCANTGGPVRFEFEENIMAFPDTIIFALLSVTILSEVNKDCAQNNLDGYIFTLGDEQFNVNDWWGREEDFRPIADRHNTNRLTLNF